MTTRRIAVDGLDFHALTEEEAVAEVVTALSNGRGGTIITPNVDILRQLQRREMRHFAERADLVLADGAPVVLASRLAGDPLPERVTGSSLIHSLSQAVLGSGGGVMLLGGQRPDVTHRAAENLALTNPSGSVVPYYPPYGFERSEGEMVKITQAIKNSDADVIFVGLGFPKQESVAHALRAEHPSKWFIGCGGSIAMLAGEIPRAPVWVREIGAEWLHRLFQEPRRLARRYLVDDLPYAISLIARSGAAGFWRSLTLRFRARQSGDVRSTQRAQTPGRARTVPLQHSHKSEPLGGADETPGEALPVGLGA